MNHHESDNPINVLAFPSACLLISLAVGLSNSCSHGSKTTEASDPAQAVTVAVARVTREDLANNLVIAAEFRPFQEIDVHAKVAGFVKSILVDVGDHVAKGQLVAVLEIPELRDELQQAEASVRMSQEEIQRAQGDLERAESAHDVAHLSSSRLVAVVNTRPNLVAQQDIDDAQGRDRVAEAQVAAAKAGLAAAREQLEVSKATQEKAKAMLAYSQITAPFGGVITHRYADTGSMIQAGTASQSQAMPLVKLSENHLLRLIIPVPESAVPKIHLGTPVEVRVSVLSEPFQGAVARFADNLDLSTRTMQTEVDVPNPRLELVPGMYANATIRLDQKRRVLTVPVQALDRKESQVTVFRVNAESRIEELPVTLGLETPARAELTSGLKENDTVVVSGRSQLRPGEAVKPKIIEATSGAGGN
jgi:RND family efflux transporter MFP subunit